MMKALNLSILVIFLIATPCYGQIYSDIISTSNENTHDSVIFQHCLDSIKKYVNLDSRKIKPYIAVCEEMLSGQAELSDRHRFSYVIERIYIEYDKDNLLGVLEIIEDNRKMLDWEGVLPQQKSEFTFTEGFSLLLLGEVEDAQKTFYELLDGAKAEQDTTLMLQSLFSLGKLFRMQNDFVNAEKYSLKYLK